jgi:hypothetical protein
MYQGNSLQDNRSHLGPAASAASRATLYYTGGRAIAATAKLCINAVILLE